MREKLRLNCSPLQLPLGLEDKLRGHVDVIEERAYAFEGPFGNDIKEVLFLVMTLQHRCCLMTTSYA